MGQHLESLGHFVPLKLHRFDRERLYTKTLNKHTCSLLIRKGVYYRMFQVIQDTQIITRNKSILKNLGQPQYGLRHRSLWLTSIEKSFEALN